MSVVFFRIFLIDLICIIQHNPDNLYYIFQISMVVVFLVFRLYSIQIFNWAKSETPKADRNDFAVDVAVVVVVADIFTRCYLHKSREGFFVQVESLLHFIFWYIRFGFYSPYCLLGDYVHVDVTSYTFGLSIVKLIQNVI